MGSNDAKEMLEVAQAEYIRLEKHVSELEEMVRERDKKYVKDNDILFLARKQAERERDAALAVIEQVRAQVDACRSMAAEGLVTPDAASALDLVVRGLDPILTQSPASALAKVKADVLREAAAAIPEQMRITELEVHEVDYLSLLPEHPRAMLHGSTKFASRLIALADRIEKEATGD